MPVKQTFKIAVLNRSTPVGPKQRKKTKTVAETFEFVLPSIVQFSFVAIIKYWLQNQSPTKPARLFLFCVMALRAKLPSRIDKGFWLLLAHKSKCPAGKRQARERVRGNLASFTENFINTPRHCALSKQSHEEKSFSAS
ncbi:hypothetical protein [Pedobacter sp. MW01-1-1]|uniref:hypothetical protein n=1 Tax=Pedobacter sp. MW01-1-1 TaxID=3383027 RepID=UPI003FEEF52A